MPIKFSKLIQFSFFSILTLLIFFNVYRLVFAVEFWQEIDGDLWQAIYLGLKFDMRLAVLIVLPILLLGWIKWLHPTNHSFGKLFWRGYLLIIFTTTVLIYLVDFGYYAYLKTHINPTIVRFIDNKDIALLMLWQSYPVIWLLVLLALIIGVFYFVLRQITTKIQVKSESLFNVKTKIITKLIVVALVLLSLYGKFSLYPLRWSDAHFSNHRFVADLIANPVLFGLNAWRYSEPESYDKAKMWSVFPAIKQYLKIANNNDLDFKRPLTLTARVADKTNLVLVFLESFAGYKTGHYGNPLNSSPNFDKLAQDSLVFSRYYVAHTGTARSIFTTITGIPDVHSVKTATRNPLIVNQNTIINAFVDYDKFYFLGGSANWGNIRGLLANNIDDLQIYEEGSYTAPIQDVWGVSDADLFLEASKVLRTKTAPFVAIIQTSGNHRPYTIPQLNYGFKLSKYSEAEVKQYGFESLAELNSFRFMDHSIGVFIESAKKYKFYDNTMFVFFADHGISANNGQHRPKIESKLSLGTYYVPLVLHAPKYLKPEINSTIASHSDILPIVAGIMGKPYINTSLGRNMLAEKYQNQQYAFTISHGAISEMGLISKNFRLIMDTNLSSVKLYDLNQTEKANNVAAKYPKITQQMQELTNAIYQSAKYLMYHNLPAK